MADVLNQGNGQHYPTIVQALAAGAGVVEIQDSDVYNEAVALAAGRTLQVAANQTPTIKGGSAGVDVITVSGASAGTVIQGASTTSRLTIWNTYAGTVAIQQGSCVRLASNNIGITLRNLTWRGTEWPGSYSGVDWWQYLGAGLNCTSGTQENNPITISHCGSYDDALGYAVICNDLKTFVGTDLSGSYQDAMFRCLYWGGTIDRAEIVAPAWFRLWLTGNSPLFWNHMTHRLARAALVSRSRLVTAANRQGQALWLLSSGADGLRRMDLLNCTLAAGDANAQTLKGLYLGAYAVPGGSRFENLVITDFATRVESGHATGITLVESDVYGAAGTDYAGTAAAGAGCIDADPLYADLAGNNVRLQATSPCKWSGMDSGVTPDPDGNASPQPSGTSMGAFEVVAPYNPQVTTLSPDDANHCVVQFDSEMDVEDPEFSDPENYPLTASDEVDPGAPITVGSVTADPEDPTVAILQHTKGTIGKHYRVDVSGDVKSLEGVGVDPDHNSATMVAVGTAAVVVSAAWEP